jgi:hypothetical protein
LTFLASCPANRYWPVSDTNANRPETRTAKTSPPTKHQPPNASKAAAAGLRAKLTPAMTQHIHRQRESGSKIGNVDDFLRSPPVPAITPVDFLSRLPT